MWHLQELVCGCCSQLLSAAVPWHRDKGTVPKVPPMPGLGFAFLPFLCSLYSSHVSSSVAYCFSGYFPQYFFVAFP